jgi:hypothetical protein
VLEEDLARLDAEYLNEHEVLHAALTALPFVGTVDLAGDDVFRPDLLAVPGNLALVEVVSMSPMSASSVLSMCSVVSFRNGITATVGLFSCDQR